MSNPLLIGFVYLMAALGVEQGALPALGRTWGGYGGWAPPTEIRLLALGAIMAGLLRGEAQGAIFAAISAAIAGAMPGPGFLGCTLFSFVLASTLAAYAARWFYIRHALVRLPVLFFLIVVESWAWSAARRVFWPGTAVEIQWGAHAVTAALGMALLPLFARWLRWRAAPPVPIGRRK